MGSYMGRGYDVEVRWEGYDCGKGTEGYDGGGMM